ncbi:MAG: hypothetical protein ABEJ79_12200 [Halolamina sp.]
MTNHNLLSAVLAAKALVFVLGATVTYFAAQAAARTESTALEQLALGFGIVTAGAAVGGLLDWVVGLALDTSVLAQTLLTAVGFAVVLRSLYVPTNDDGEGPESDAETDTEADFDGRPRA